MSSTCSWEGLKIRANPSFFAKRVGKPRDTYSKRLCDLFLEQCEGQQTTPRNLTGFVFVTSKKVFKDQGDILMLG